MNTLKFYVFSIYCYGCEAWTLKKVLERKIEFFLNVVLKKDGKIQMVRPHFEREGAKDLENKTLTFAKHQRKEIKVFWSYQKEGEHSYNSSRGQNGGEETKRQTSQHLVCGHQGMDRAKGRGMQQDGCRSEPVGCHLASTFVEKMTSPGNPGNELLKARLNFYRI